MALDPQSLKLEGIYQQSNGRYMQRIKLAGGVISASQAEKVADLADQLAGGIIHLTTRGSMELHGLAETELPLVARQLASVGLISRGACGGAARGISCSTTGASNYPVVQVLARKLQQHFTQNPHFEGLPKKFKIGVEAGYDGARHLIQDAGLVLANDDPADPRFDVWVAGGLGKEPQPAFLLTSSVAEAELIPLLEDIITIYRIHTPKGRRLKHLVREIGEEGLRTLLKNHRSPQTVAPLPDAFPKSLTHTEPVADITRLEAAIFAGQLTSSICRGLARIAHDCANGFMVVTTDQNIVLFAPGRDLANKTSAALAALGFTATSVDQQVPFRICPGSHDCRMGLAPTRDLARHLLDSMGPEARRLSWAISGCHNSCSQPQLADFGIMAAKLVKDESGKTIPLFTLHCRHDATALGQVVATELTFAALVERVAQLG